MKGAAFKNYWDTDLGISFIPWEKIKSQEELDSVVEGGWIDPATCPPGMKPSTQTKGECCRGGFIKILSLSLPSVIGKSRRGNNKARHKSSRLK